MPNEFKVKNGLLVSGSANIASSGSAVFTIDGTAGRLFTVDDTTSGSLFSVNTSAGLPIIEAFSDNTVRIGQFGQRALFVSQSKVGINKESALNGLLDVSGSLTVTGSVGILGAVSASSYTGSLLGTASFATSASQAITSSYILQAVSASFATSASRAISSSFAISASWAPGGGGGGGTPGGANTTIQFNDAGAFSGSGDFTFDKSTNKTRLNGDFFLANSKFIYFEDSFALGSGYISYYPTNYGAASGQDLYINNGKNGVIEYNTGNNSLSTASAHLWNMLGSPVAILNAGGNLGIGTGIDFTDPFSFPKAKLYVQTSGSTILLASGSSGELLKVVDSGSNFPTIAVFSSGSRSTLTVTTSSIIVTGSVHVEQGGVILDAIGDPTSSAADTVTVYAKNIGGRMFPKWIGPSGVDTPFQPNIMFNNISFITPGGGNNITQFGCTVTTVGTVTNPTLSTGGVKNQTRRIAITSGTTAGNSGSLRVNNLECWRGNATGQGGFFVNARFGFSGSLQTGMRSFIGLMDTVGSLTLINPLTDTTLSKIGLAITASTGTNWFIINNNAGTIPTSASLGAGFPIDTTTLYELVLFCRPSGSVVDYRVTNLSSSLAVSGTLSTNLPSATTFLGRYAWVTNNTTAAAVAIEISRFSIESDY